MSDTVLLALITGAFGFLSTGFAAWIALKAKALAGEAKADNSEVKKQTTDIAATVEKVHTLTNSNMTALKADLTIANDRIAALQGLVETTANQRINALQALVGKLQSSVSNGDHLSKPPTKTGA